GLGAACALQDVPFQTSASGISPEPLSETPTASQNVADVHDTANSAADVEPAGLGTDWIFHEVPFQTSARMIPLWPFWEPPTASQNRATGHETPSRAGETAGVVSLAGLGVACFCHAVPFQASASVSVMPEVLRNEPTAVHEVADRQDIDLISPP